MIKHIIIKEKRSNQNVEVVVECDESLCMTHGPLEHEIAEQVSKQIGRKAEWDSSVGEWYELQKRPPKKLPRIKRLGLSIKFPEP